MKGCANLTNSHCSTSKHKISSNNDYLCQPMTTNAQLSSRFFDSSAFLALALALFSFISFAQQTLPISHDTTTIKREFVLHSSGQIHSNHLNAAASRKILFGGFITDDEIGKSVDKLKTDGINRTGAVFNVDVVYSDYEANLFGKKQFGYVITAGHQTFLGTSYPSDVFRLLSQGNTQTPETIDLTDTRFYQMSHHKLGFGILDKKSRSSFALNIIGASGYQNLDMMNGVFRQNASKDTTDVILIGSYSGNNSAQFLRGLGMGVDVDLRMPVKIKEKEVIVQVLAQNVGFVRMNNNTYNYQLDTNYRYTGFNLQQIQELANNADFMLEDSLNLVRQTGGSTQWLPGFVQVAKIVNRDSEQKFQAFYGLNVYTQIIYMPQVFAGAHWQANEKISAGIHGHLGGFGGARLGCYAEMRLGQFNLGLSSQDILGTAANLGFGHSLLFRLSWQQK